MRTPLWITLSVLGLLTPVLISFAKDEMGDKMSRRRAGVANKSPKSSRVKSSPPPIVEPSCRTQIVLSPNGIAKSAEAGVAVYMERYEIEKGEPWVKAVANAGLKKSKPTRSKSFKLPKGLLGQGWLENEEVYFSMDRMQIVDLEHSPPKIVCGTENKCKVSVEVKRIKFASDLSIFCVNAARCNPNPPIQIKQMALSLDKKDFPTEKPITLEYEAEFNPANHLSEVITVVNDPPGKINLPFEVIAKAKPELFGFDEKVGEHIEIQQAELYKAREEIIADCNRQQKPLSSEQAIVMARTWVEARQIARRKKYASHLPNDMSADYFFLIKDAFDRRIQEKSFAQTEEEAFARVEVGAMFEHFMDTQLAPQLGEVISEAVANAEVFEQGIYFTLPQETVKSIVDNANTKEVWAEPPKGQKKKKGKDKKSDQKDEPQPKGKKRSYRMDIVGAGFDKYNRGAIIEVSGCPKTLARSEDRPGTIDPVSEIQPGVNPPKDFDFAFSVDLETLNSYLKKSFEDPDENRIHIRPANGKSLGALGRVMKFFNVDPEIKMFFKQAPEVQTRVIEVDELNPATGKTEKKLKIEPYLRFVIDERQYSTFLTKYVPFFDRENKGMAEITLKDFKDPVTGVPERRVQLDIKEFTRQPKWSKFGSFLGGVISRPIGGLVKDAAFEREYPKAVDGKLNFSPGDLVGIDIMELRASPDGTAIQGYGKFEDLYEVISRAPSDSDNQIGDPIPEPK